MNQSAGSRPHRQAQQADEPSLSFWIARQPIFDRHRKLAAYELLFRGNSDSPGAQFIDGTQATAQVIVQGAMSTDLEAVSGGLPMFVNFTHELLVGDTALALDPKAYVIEVLEEVPATPSVLSACKRLLTAGYRVALDDVTDPARVEAFAGAATLVKIDWMQTPNDRIGEIARIARRKRMELLAEKIEDESDLRLAEELRCDYLQGFYLSRPESLRRSALPSIEPAHARLLQAVSRPDLDLDEVTKALEADPAVTYRLLRTVNSAAHALNRRVTSIREVVLFLGQDEIRRVATLVMLGSITGGAEHLLLEAVAKARFCDNLAAELGESGDRQFHYYMTGLLSGIDGLLGCSMAEALAPLPLSDDVTEALIDRHGLAADALGLATSYLHGDWFQADFWSTHLGIDDRCLNGIHRAAVEIADAAIAA
jgi:c-di-GMP-related signal transduction protein